jgi:hypothetical protein
MLAWPTGHSVECQVVHRVVDLVGGVRHGPCVYYLLLSPLARAGSIKTRVA